MSKLLERDHRRSSRSSSRSSHHSTARSRALSEDDQGHQQNQGRHRRDIPHQQENLNHPQHQERHLQEMPHQQANMDSHLHLEDRRRHHHELPQHQALRVSLANNHVDLKDDEDYLPHQPKKPCHQDRHRHHDDEDDERKPRFNPPRWSYQSFMAPTTGRTTLHGTQRSPNYSVYTRCRVIGKSTSLS